ncbi:MAG: peptidase S8, partial [bacterium]|nr:peptidase S8 [bacterium]
AGFSSEDIIETGKSHGLGIKSLHSQGITGKGIKVAIIDYTPRRNHVEYRDQLVEINYIGKSKDIKGAMHGTATASLLVGKNCGVAQKR